MKLKEVFLLKTLRFLFVIAVLTSLAGFVKAEQYLIPADSNGSIPGDVSLVGVDVIDSTGTQVYGTTTPVVLYGVCTSSIAVTAYATLRDSDTLNSSSDIKMQVYPSGLTVAGNVQTLCTTFPAPVIFRNGMSISLSAAAGGGSNRWMFFIRRRVIGSARGLDTSLLATSASD